MNAKYKTEKFDGSQGVTVYVALHLNKEEKERQTV